MDRIDEAIANESNIVYMLTHKHTLLISRPFFVFF